jgi:glycine/D-amino acid oxidase-like deaminating enzyme
MSGRKTDWDVIVAGAGVFGAWTAWELQRRGRRVLLVDGAGPANARASSGGESRLTRTIYGVDAVYTRMARDSLEAWRWLSGRAGLPVLHAAGVLMFFHRMEAYASASIEVHRALGLPLEELDRAELVRRYPQVAWDGIELGLLEREHGILMARRGVQTLVAEFVAAGGEYRPDDVATPSKDGSLSALHTVGGAALRAREFVFACGPWLPKLFPDILGARIFTTRQEVFFFATPRGDVRFRPEHMPAWVDFDAGNMYYGCPDLESRGFKLGNDRHGPPFDPDFGDRRPTEAGLSDARTYLARRFPALAGQPLVENRVCQYENSSSGDFLIDRHPRIENLVLVGGGSGHGFKHGPAVGRYAADLVTGKPLALEPRFSLASNAGVQARTVR